MGNFSDYINEKEKSNLANNKIFEEDVSVEDSLKNKINKYSSYSQDDLMNEFLKLTIEKKKQGKLDNDELSSLKKTIEPMLNNEQKKTMNNLFEMVKNVK